MNEIEVKAKLKDKKLVLEKLKKLGAEIISNKYQKDIVFWPNNIKEINTHILGSNFMRIREQKLGETKKVLFTLKQPQTNQTNCLEYEIEIQEKDIGNLTALIKTLGFYEFVIIEKNRETLKLKDIEICLDNVTNLGLFIELEQFGLGENAEKIQQELYKLLESLSVQKEDFIYDGYDILMKNKS